MAKRVLVGNIEQIPKGEGRVFDAGGTAVAVFRSRSGELFGTQPTCPHRGGPLADGLLGQSTLICPLHEWQFDLRDGRPVSGECPLRVYPVAADERGQISVELPDE